VYWKFINNLWAVKGSAGEEGQAVGKNVLENAQDRNALEWDLGYYWLAGTGEEREKTEIRTE